jgi:5-(carboxyamino)imidazole ribonucleotide mutase/phosphoribosylaminoimidazole-succinocarboxamide synthase
MTANVIIMMGSKADLAHVEKIVAALAPFDLSAQLCVASAHKSPAHLLQLLAEFEANPAPKVYITVAGRSNALSGMVDASVAAPVIACPPYSDAFGGADVYSSLRMPSGVAPALVLEPGNAALLAAKILGKTAQVKAFQQRQTAQLLEDHDDIQHRKLSS